MIQTATKYNNLHQQLIERCKKGDQTAQFEIYKLYYKSMYNTSLRIVNCAGDAEDIMQESFLSAFSKIDFYRGEVAFGAWLKRIVINHSLDYLRKRRINFEPISNDLVVLNEVEDDNSDINEEVEKIKSAINELPDGYRIIFSLFMLEGYDHDEISQILDINPSTSRSQMARAKKKLLELLKTKG